MILAEIFSLKKTHRHSRFDSLDEMKLLLEVLFLAVGLCITNGASVDSAKPLGIGQYPSTYFLVILTKKITRSQAELKVCDFLVPML